MIFTKLFSKDEKTKGKTITLPLVGDVTFDNQDNSIDIDSEKVESLLAKDFGIELVRISNSNHQSEMLEALDLGELKELLSTYPPKETRKLSIREDIVQFLNKKLK